LARENSALERVPDAGKVINGFQIMHNGIRVVEDCYYGPGMTDLLRQNRGCHEPREELLFSQLLKGIEPGSAIVELGAFWGFYSMWFLSSCAKGKAVLVEPDEGNLEICRRNFVANGLQGVFINASIGTCSFRCKRKTVDEILASEGLSSVAILHVDIQGAEFEMLDGATESLRQGRIKTIFLSTHSAELHTRCLEKIASFGFNINVSVPPSESFSVDGFILADRQSQLLDTAMIPPSEETSPLAQQVKIC